MGYFTQNQNNAFTSSKGRPVMKTIRSFAFALGLVAASASFAITGGSVDTALRGTWVPAKVACTSALKVVVEANKVTFVNGAQQQAYTKLDQCFSCAGRDVQNVIWLSTDAMGDSPFIIHFDTAKKV